MSKHFSLPITVYYEDTDCMNVVYHANYLKFFERTRFEFVRQLAFDHPTWFQSGHKIFVKKIEVEYCAPARLGDKLISDLKVTRIGGASFALAQRVLRDEVVLVHANVVLVYVDEQDRPCPILPELRKELEPYV